METGWFTCDVAVIIRDTLDSGDNANLLRTGVLTLEPIGEDPTGTSVRIRHRQVYHVDATTGLLLNPETSSTGPHEAGVGMYRVRLEAAGHVLEWEATIAATHTKAAPLNLALSRVTTADPPVDVLPLPGPANILKIGTVTSGATASATITGTSPSQTLNLTLPVGPAPTVAWEGDRLRVGGVLGPSLAGSADTAALAADAYDKALAAARSVGSLFLNGDFEQPRTNAPAEQVGWPKASPEHSFVAGAGINGSTAIRRIAPSASATIYPDTFFPTTAGRSYYVEGWVKVDGPNSAVLGESVAFIAHQTGVESATAWVGTTGSDKLSNTTWTKVSGTFTITRNVQQMRFGLWVAKTSNAYLWDNLIAYAVPGAGS